MSSCLQYGATRACLYAVENWDEAREALTVLVRIGVKTFGSELTNQVDTGSSTHCLLGQRPSRRLISRPVTDVNATIRQSVGQMTNGCSAPAVQSFCKNVANSSFAVKRGSAFFE